MKSKIIILFYIFLISCNGQKKYDAKPINEKIIIKKLDNASLNKILKINKKYQNIIFTNKDTIVELVDNDDYFLESKSKKGESIFNRIAYDKKSHLMIASGAVFIKIKIGIHRKYNEKGQIISEINYDDNYPFSIYELIEKIKLTHKIDLNDTSKIRAVEREFDESFNKFIYAIRYKNNENEPLKYIVVDAKTGVILKEGIVKIIV